MRDIAKAKTALTGGRMIKLMRVAIIGITLMLAGCSSVQVSQDYRLDTDFAKYRSYEWQAIDTGPESDNIRLNNPLLHERFHQAIDRILASRGYPRQTTADFLVSYTYSVETRLESYPYGSHVGMGFARRHRFGGFDYGDVDIDQYYVGILAINFYDAVSKTLIWRGLGSERVDMHATPEETTAFVDKLVTAVLSQFPPAHRSN